MFVELIEAIVSTMGDPTAPTQPILFGHGPRDFANLSTCKNTQLWLYPFRIVDTVEQSGLILTRYSYLIDIHTRTELYNNATELKDALQAMDEKSYEFEVKLAADPIVFQDKNLRLRFNREPLYHQLDANLTGYAISGEVMLKEQRQICNLNTVEPEV